MPPNPASCRMRSATSCSRAALASSIDRKRLMPLRWTERSRSVPKGRMRCSITESELRGRWHILDRAVFRNGHVALLLRFNIKRIAQRECISMINGEACGFSTTGPCDETRHCTHPSFTGGAELIDRGGDPAMDVLMAGAFRSVTKTPTLTPKVLSYSHQRSRAAQRLPDAVQYVRQPSASTM